MDGVRCCHEYSNAHVGLLSGDGRLGWNRDLYPAPDAPPRGAVVGIPGVGDDLGGPEGVAAKASTAYLLGFPWPLTRPRIRSRGLFGFVSPWATSAR